MHRTTTDRPSAKMGPRLGERLRSALDAVVEIVASPTAETGAAPTRVSVVIPTYQNRDLVVAAVEAALAQVSPTGDEVIVVDDGSRDGTDAAMRALVTTASARIRYARLRRNLGRSVARNAGIALATGTIVAFTDSDCVATDGWVAAGVAAFTGDAIGIVQGRTGPRPDQRQPFFNHFIEIQRFDGTFSTCNVFYRRQALLEVDGFDPAVVYWEDVDLGWRVRRRGWEAVFTPDAVVHHHVVPLSPWKWLKWPRHFAYMPAKVARYPEYRGYLFLGLWVHWFHALFDLAVIGGVLAVVARPVLIALVVPYLVAFPFRHGLGGRWPPVKAAFHFVWDVITFGVLLASSIRHRAVVL